MLFRREKHTFVGRAILKNRKILLIRLFNSNSLMGWNKTLLLLLIMLIKFTCNPPRSSPHVHTFHDFDFSLDGVKGSQVWGKPRSRDTSAHPTRDVQEGKDQTKWMRRWNPDGGRGWRFPDWARKNRGSPKNDRGDTGLDYNRGRGVRRD